MEVGEELARRGHQVTVVSPHQYKKVPQGISDIVIPSEFDQYTTEVTLEFLNNPNTQLPISGVSHFFLPWSRWLFQITHHPPTVELDPVIDINL